MVEVVHFRVNEHVTKNVQFGTAKKKEFEKSSKLDQVPTDEKKKKSLSFKTISLIAKAFRPKKKSPDANPEVDNEIDSADRKCCNNCTII